MHLRISSIFSNGDFIDRGGACSGSERGSIGVGWDGGGTGSGYERGRWRSLHDTDSELQAKIVEKVRGHLATESSDHILNKDIWTWKQPLPLKTNRKEFSAFHRGLVLLTINASGYWRIQK